jgi:CRP-like cAMP-binding protein
MSEDGEEEGLFFADSGSTVGGAPILQGVAIPADVVVTKTGLLAVLNRASVMRLLADSQFTLALSRAVAGEALAVAKRRSARGMRSSKARVVATLLPMMDSPAPDQMPIINSPGNETIAKLAGVSRETVSRVLSSLERSGTISKNGRRLHVLDLSSLQQFAARRRELCQASPQQGVT